MKDCLPLGGRKNIRLKAPMCSTLFLFGAMFAKPLAVLYIPRGTVWKGWLHGGWGGTAGKNSHVVSLPAEVQS